MELTNLPHKIYKQGNQVVIKPHGQKPRRYVTTITYTEEIEGNIRFAYGSEGIWLAPSNFLKADGTPWGSTSEEAVANYLATNTVMENSSRVNMPVPTPVRVVNFPDAPQGGGGISTNVSVLNLPETQPVSGNVGVTGHVSVDNFPQTQAVSGALEVSNFPENQSVSGEVEVTNFPDVQPVFGEVSVDNFPEVQKVTVENIPATHKVEVINQPGTQAVSGHVTVDNFPASQGVSLTEPAHVIIDNFPSTQPVSGSVSVSNLPATQPISGTVNVQGGNSQAVKVDNSGVTQPISGSVSVNNLPNIQAVGGTVAVNNFPASQPVTGTVTANVQGGNGTAVKVDGTVNVGNLPAVQPVSGTFWPATQPVSGTVNANVTFPANQTVTVSNPTTAVTATIAGIPQVQIVPTEAKWQFFNNSLSAVNGIDLAPAQAGKRNHLVGLQVAGLVPLLSGDVQILDGTTVIYQFALAANATLQVNFDQPLFSSPGNALRIRCAVTGLNMRISAQGFAIAN